MRIDDDVTANAAAENTVAHSMATAPRGYFELTIDTTTGHLKRAVKTITTESGTTVTYEYRFSRYGQTTVERPQGVPRFSLKAIFYDVVY
ncbi:hypothetical protein [Haladaptatus sp. NG-SE-30]